MFLYFSSKIEKEKRHSSTADIILTPSQSIDEDLPKESRCEC